MDELSMKTKTVAVVGAGGVVGRGIVSVLARAGHRVICIGRDRGRLDRAARSLGSGVSAIVADVGSAAQVESLAAALHAEPPDVIVTTVNGARGAAPVYELAVAELERVLRENLATHLIAAQHLIPSVKQGGMYLGIGGGMADLVFPGNAAISMAQAAQRALFNYLAKENTSGVAIRELLLYSMIAPGGEVQETKPHQLCAEDVGRHLAAIIAEPESFAGPILSLKSRKHVGLPEKIAA